MNTYRIDISDNEEENAVEDAFHACKYGLKDMLEIALEHGAKPHITSFHCIMMAAAHYRMDFIDVILDILGPIDEKELSCSCDRWLKYYIWPAYSKWDIFIYCVETNNYNAIQYFAKIGVKCPVYYSRYFFNLCSSTRMLRALEKIGMSLFDIDFDQFLNQRKYECLYYLEERNILNRPGDINYRKYKCIVDRTRCKAASIINLNTLRFLCRNPDFMKRQALSSWKKLFGDAPEIDIKELSIMHNKGE